MDCLDYELITHKDVITLAEDQAEKIDNLEALLAKLSKESAGFHSAIIRLKVNEVRMIELLKSGGVIMPENHWVAIRKEDVEKLIERMER